jgi:hypothetical protein
MREVSMIIWVFGYAVICGKLSVTAGAPPLADRRRRLSYQLSDERDERDERGDSVIWLFGYAIIWMEVSDQLLRALRLWRTGVGGSVIR